MSACDDDEGRPYHQVVRFQVIAPIRPARTSIGVTTEGSTTPFPMVLATWTPKTRKATKLKKAAQITAARGESTRVLTIVAIEFAASWEPLLKSNASATAMMNAISSGIATAATGS